MLFCVSPLTSLGSIRATPKSLNCLLMITRGASHSWISFLTGAWCTWWCIVPSNTTRRGWTFGASHRSIMIDWALSAIAGGFSIITFRGGGATLGARILIILRPIGVGILGGASRITSASLGCTIGGRVRMTMGGAGGGTIGAYFLKTNFKKNNLSRKLFVVWVDANLLLNDNLTRWWQRRWL